MENSSRLEQAIKEAKTKKKPNKGNDETRKLFHALQDSSISENELATALESTIDGLNQYALLRTSIQYNRDELENKLSSLEEKCNNIDPYIGNVISKQVQSKQEMLSEETSSIQHFGIEKRYVELSVIVDSYLKQEKNERRDLSEKHSEAEKDLADFRENFIRSESGRSYNSLIPNHFANTVESILQRAEESHSKGNEERAEGFVIASEMLLEAVQQCYSIGRIQRQLTDLAALRSNKYEMVRK